MKGLIVYASKSGNTKTIVDKLKTFLDGDYDTANIQELATISAEPYDKIIIGAHVRLTRINEDIMSYVERNKKALLEKKLFIFVSAAKTGNEFKKEVTSSFPKEILEEVTVHNLGTRFVPEKLNFVERVVVRGLAQDQGVNVEDLNPITDAKVEQFAFMVNAA